MRATTDEPFRSNTSKPHALRRTSLGTAGGFEVYVQTRAGADPLQLSTVVNNFIEALNYRMGDDDFFRFLKDYTSRYGRGRASASDFFAVARQNTTADISDLINAYFKGSY